MEIWKDVVGYEGLYKVSTYGRVYSCRKNMLLSTPTNRKKGYVDIVLFKNGRKKTEKVHRLVAKAFLPNPYNYPIINHKDENPSNNRVDNLEWCTNDYNLMYGNAKKKQSLAHCSLSEEDIVKCASLFDEGYSMSDIAKVFNVSSTTISRAITKSNKYNGIAHTTNEKIRENGIRATAKKKTKLTEEQRIDCYERYLNGEMQKDIAKHYKVSGALVSIVIKSRREVDSYGKN